MENLDVQVSELNALLSSIIAISSQTMHSTDDYDPIETGNALFGIRSLAELATKNAENIQIGIYTVNGLLSKMTGAVNGKDDTI